LKQALGYKLQIVTSHNVLETPMSHPKKVKIRKRDAQKFIHANNELMSHHTNLLPPFNDVTFVQAFTANP
jgi:hypothetical protein